MKTIAVAVLALVCVTTSFGQKTSSGLLPVSPTTTPALTTNLVRNDGDVIKVSWSWNQAPAGTSAGVSLFEINSDGGPTNGTSITGFNNPATAGLPLVIRGQRSGMYQLFINWYDINRNLIRTIPYGQKFWLKVPVRTLSARIETTSLFIDNAVWINWRSTGIPAGAKIQITLKGTNSWDVATLVDYSLDTHGYFWRIDSYRFTPGQYNLQLDYFTTIGINEVISCSSLPIPITIQ